MKKSLLVTGLILFSILQHAAAQTWLFANETFKLPAANLYDVRMAVDRFGSVYQIGMFSGQISFGTQTFYSTGTSDLYITQYNAAGKLVYARQLNISQAAVGPYDITIDGEGTPVIIGSFTGTISMEWEHPTLAPAQAIVAGQRSFAARLSRNGRAIWVTTSSPVGGNPADQYTAVTADKQGGIYVAYNRSYGTYSTLASYLKINLSGNTVGGSGASAGSNGSIVNASAEDIAVDESGNIYLGGIFSTTVVFGANELQQNHNHSNVFLSKFNNTTSSWEWAKQSTSVYKASFINNTSIAISAAGPVISNAAIDCFNFQGVNLWNRSTGTKVKSITADTSGIYITGGFIQVSTYNFQPHSGYVKKYNASGTVLWEKKFAKVTAADPSSGFGSAIAMLNPKTIIVSGTITGGLAHFGDHAIASTSGHCTQFIASVSQEPWIRVLTPNGGESLTGNSFHVISWESELVSNVNIKYRSGTQTQTIASNLSSANKQYTWVVPTVNNQSGSIIIEDAANSNIRDESDGQFIIHSPKLIQLLSPNGGDTIRGGSQYQIRWNTRFIDRIDILYSSNGQMQSVAGNIDAASGQYDWHVPYLDQQSVRIIIRETANPATKDSSDSEFFIASPQLISILSPGGAEKLYAGNTHVIQWSYNGTDPVVIDYSTDNGNTWRSISGNYANTGNYNWTVPFTDAANSRIRIRSTLYPISAISNSFSILNPAIITVLMPNGGELWAPNTSSFISWKTNKSDDFLIEYSFDGGNNWQQIAIYNPGPGYNTRTPVFYTWAIPANTPSSIKCLVRVSPANGNGNADMSDNYFTITSNNSLSVDKNVAGANSITAGASGRESSMLYPNPVTRMLNIELNGVKDEQHATIEIISMTGQKVQSRNVQVLHGRIFSQIDMSGVSKGLYMAVVKTRNNSFQFPFVKK